MEKCLTLIVWESALWYLLSTVSAVWSITSSKHMKFYLVLSKSHSTNLCIIPKHQIATSCILTVELKDFIKSIIYFFLLQSVGASVCIATSPILSYSLHMKVGSSWIAFHNSSKFLPRAISGFHINQSIHVPVFLPNLPSQPSGKLNFTHLDLVRTLTFFLVGESFFCISSTKLLRRMPRLSLAFTGRLGTGLIYP